MPGYKFLPFFSRQFKFENIIQNSVLGTVKTETKSFKTKKWKISIYFSKCHTEKKSSKILKIE